MGGYLPSGCVNGWISTKWVCQWVGVFPVGVSMGGYLLSGCVNGWVSSQWVCKWVGLPIKSDLDIKT